MLGVIRVLLKKNVKTNYTSLEFSDIRSRLVSFHVSSTLLVRAVVRRKS